MSFLGERIAVALGVSQHSTLSSGPLSTKLSPALLLNFVGTTALDPRITFTRSTTATYYNSAGVLSTAAINAPRLDYNPATLASVGLLIEEQRVNLAVRSEDFTNATWVKTRSSVTSNAIAAPDGATTADKLVEDSTATSTHFCTQTVALVANQTYVLSVFAKAGERGRIVMQTGAVSNWVTEVQVGFDLTTGTLFSASGLPTTPGTITPVGNGWYRCSIVGTMKATGTSGNMNIYLCPNGTANFTYTGNGTSGAYLWGAQVEAGAFITSYIPTVASQVTRAADVAVMTGTNFSDWYNATEGSLYAEYSAVASGIRTIMSINDTTANESIRLRTSTTNPLFTVTDGGVDQADIDAGTVASNTIYKFSGGYAANSFAASIAGGTAVTDTSGTVPTVTQAALGNNAASDYLNGYIRQIAYYPRRLSDAQLQGITK